MPDITVYMTQEDEEKFIQYIFEAGAWLTPDMHYLKPQPVEIRCIKGYKGYRQMLIRKFYIQRQDFTKSALVFRPLNKDDALIYYIGQREGGPYVDFSGGGI